MKNATDKKNINYCWGFILIILGFTTLGFMYIGAIFLILGVCLIIGTYISKSRVTSKSPYTTFSRKFKCPKCGRTIYSDLEYCYNCGYVFPSELQQIPSTPVKKIEEPNKTSDAPLFPPISELILDEKTSKPEPSTSEIKSEEIEIEPSIVEKKVEESFKSCPHCKQKLPIGAKFCFNCGQKVEVIKPIPPIPSKKETNANKIMNWVKYQYYDLGRDIQDIANDLDVSMIAVKKLLDRIEIISKSKDEKAIKGLTPLKTEELQEIPSVIEIEEEPQVIPAEELHPIPPVIEIEEEPQIIPAEEVELIKPVLDIKERKRKLAPLVCKYCGMRIPKKSTFCIQCGMILKNN